MAEPKKNETSEFTFWNVVWIAIIVLIIIWVNYSGKTANPDKTVTLLESMVLKNGKDIVGTPACKYFEIELKRIDKKNNSDLSNAVGSRPGSSENSTVSDFMSLAGDCIDSLAEKWILSQGQMREVEFQK